MGESGDQPLKQQEQRRRPVIRLSRFATQEGPIGPIAHNVLSSDHGRTAGERIPVGTESGSA